jgi:hypothetical protein
MLSAPSLSSLASAHLQHRAGRAQWRPALPCSVEPPEEEEKEKEEEEKEEEEEEEEREEE